MAHSCRTDPSIQDPVSLSPSKARESSELADQWAQEDLCALAAKGLVRALEPLESAQGATVRVGGETLVCLSSNDYLGLAADAGVRAAAARALEEFGLGTGASRLVVGDTVVHRALEEAVADLEGTEAARLFNSGYAANTGTIPALAGDGDVVFSDAYNHASLVDGCRLSRANVIVYPHRDVAALEALMVATPGRRRLVVTDAIFSMDGDRAPLRELAALCARERAALLVDEAHATGVVGDEGKGLSHALGVRPDLVMGTLSKALGAAGAYVAATRAVTQLLTTRARSLVFSTALPAAVCAGALAAVQRSRTDASLRERLWRNIETFASGLEALGLPAHRDSAIFSVILGAPEAALAAAKALRARGLLVKPIRPPTVPVGTSRLRFSLSAAHSTEQLHLALSALHDLPFTLSPEGAVSEPPFSPSKVEGPSVHPEPVLSEVEGRSRRVPNSSPNGAPARDD